MPSAVTASTDVKWPFQAERFSLTHRDRSVLATVLYSSFLRFVADRSPPHSNTFSFLSLHPYNKSFVHFGRPNGFKCFSQRRVGGRVNSMGNSELGTSYSSLSSQIETLSSMGAMGFL